VTALGPGQCGGPLPVAISPSRSRSPRIRAIRVIMIRAIRVIMIRAIRVIMIMLRVAESRRRTCRRPPADQPAGRLGRVQHTGHDAAAGSLRYALAVWPLADKVACGTDDRVTVGRGAGRYRGDAPRALERGHGVGAEL
jgi:hypothetical protein